MRTEPRYAVAANVRAEMARKGKRQVDLAEALGISQQATSRRLTGDIAFDVDELTTIARFLETPLSALIGEDETAVPA